jgi:hypothetical protein
VQARKLEEESWQADLRPTGEDPASLSGTLRPPEPPRDAGQLREDAGLARQEQSATLCHPSALDAPRQDRGGAPANAAQAMAVEGGAGEIHCYLSYFCFDTFHSRLLSRWAALNPRCASRMHVDFLLIDTPSTLNRKP